MELKAQLTADGFADKTVLKCPKGFFSAYLNEFP